MAHEKEILEALKAILKNEIIDYEDRLYLLEDLRLKERKLGLYEKERNVHRTLCKVLVIIRKLERDYGKGKKVRKL